MGMILKNFNTIKTNPVDLHDALTRQKDSKFCFDFGLLNREYDVFNFPFRLVPLDTDFKCERTLIYDDNKEVKILSKFGLFDGDFINIDAPRIEIKEFNYVEEGVIIFKDNPYFEIVNAIAKHFNLIDKKNGQSFILTNDELAKFSLTPFKLEDKYMKHFEVSDIEDMIEFDEYDHFMECMINNSEMGGN